MAIRGLGLSAALLVGCSRATPSAEAGRTLYEANGCVSCHGISGHGDGPAAPTLPAKPIDFRDVAQFKRGADEAAIARTLAEGISIEHTMPAPRTTHHVLAMPKFDHLTKIERRSIALFVIALRNEKEANQRKDQP
jgi:cytochrome c